MMHRQHFMKTIFDEIIIDGLPGVTLNSLWIRLKHHEAFDMKLDHWSKEFIWKSLQRIDELEYFVLPSPRPDITIIDRKDLVDEDGIFFKAVQLIDVYEFGVIDSNGILGSALDFYTRNDVTTEIHEYNNSDGMPLEVAMNRWGSKLIIVASQEKRTNLLFGDTHNRIVTPIQYAFLEIIGRSRTNGISTVSSDKIAGLFVDAKQLWYEKKKLLKQELIRLQPYCAMLQDDDRLRKGSLLQLPRFYTEYPMPWVNILGKLCSHLMTLPNNEGCLREVQQDFASIMSMKTARHITRKCDEWLETRKEKTFAELHPDLSSVELLEASGRIYGGNSHDAAARMGRVLKSVRCKKPFNFETWAADEGGNGITPTEEDYYISYPPAWNVDEAFLRQVVATLAKTPLTNKEMLLHWRINYYRLRSVLNYLKSKRYISSYTRTEGTNDVAVFCVNKTDRNNIATGAPKKNNNISGSALKVANDCRKANRREKILEVLSRDGVISSLLNLRKQIIAEEAEQGFLGQMDRKSFNRIVAGLISSGLARMIEVPVNSGNIQILCQPHITESDDCIAEIVRKHNDAFAHRKLAPSLTKRDPKDLPRFKPPPRLDKCRVRLYGWLPRMKRKQIMHEFLWYVVYGMDPDAEPVVPEDEEKGIPPVYVDEHSWKRYVKPAKCSGYPRGWFNMGDVMLSMPLRIFTSLLNMAFLIPDLKTYIMDPDKCMLPIRFLPDKMREVFVKVRQFVLSLSEVAYSLGYQGLLTTKEMESQGQKKNEMMGYLHKNAALYDTRSSDRGYNVVTTKDYPRLSFRFESVADVEQYWFYVQEIGLKTPLGYRITMPDFTEENLKLDVVVVKSIQEIVDDASFPVNEMGACGFDKSVYAHRPSNWSYDYVPGRSPAQCAPHGKNSAFKAMHERRAGTKDAYDSMDREDVYTSREVDAIVPLLSTLFEGVHYATDLITPNVEQEASTTSSPPSESRITPIEKVPRKRTASRKRIIKSEPDEVILRPKPPLLRSKKCDWNGVEDYILILCKVASVVLVGRTTREAICIAWSVVPDILSRLTSKNSDKTAAACARRLNFILSKKPMTREKMEVWQTEALYDKALLEKYQYGLGDWNRLKHNSPDEAVQIYHSLVDVLMEKFKNSFSISYLELPKSLEVLKQKYLVTSRISAGPTRRVFLDGKATHDIIVMTLYNYILGSFNLGNDANDLAHNNVFQSVINQYPNDLVSRATAFMQSNRIVTRQKAIAEMKDTDKIIGTMRLKLTQKYEQFCLSDLFLYTRHILESANLVDESLQSDDDMKLTDVTEGSTVAFLLSFLRTDKPSDLELMFSESNITSAADAQVRDGPNPESRIGPCSRRGIFRESLGIELGLGRADYHMHIGAGSIVLRPDRTAVRQKLASLAQTYETVFAILGETFCDKTARQSSVVKRCYVDRTGKSPLSQFIADGRSPGRTVEEVRERIGDDKKSKLELKNLLDSGEVRSMGITKVRYVHRDHLRPWLVHTYRALDDEPTEIIKVDNRDTFRHPDSLSGQSAGLKRQPDSHGGLKEPKAKRKKGEDVFYVPDPWSSVDGGLQPLLFKIIVENMFSRIVRSPGQTIAHLMETYTTYHQPKTIRTVVSFLRDIGAIKVTAIVRKGKCGLFSKRAERQPDDEFMWGNDHDLTLMPTCDSVINLGINLKMLLEKSDLTEDDALKLSSKRNQMTNTVIDPSISHPNPMNEDSLLSS